MHSALLDTNLVLLLIVGMTGKKYIRTHKRTVSFTEKDYELLVNIINNFDCLWITSHCLAEVSNLLKQTHDTLVSKLMSVFSNFTNQFKESHIPKSRIFENKLFFRLGVADTGFVEKSKRVTCSFTVDFDLYREVSMLGRKVINFNHLRMKELLK